MLSQARQLLAGGFDVILDASFSSDHWRRRASEVASETSSELTELRCVLPTEVAADRLAARAAEGGDVSDAGPAIAAAMTAVFDPWPSAVAVGMLPPVDDVVPSVLDRLDSPGRRRER
jgi:predicted kinase